MQATATFTLDRFDAKDPHSIVDDVAFARAEIEKTFRGDIEGTSRVEMLSARSPDGGAGYVALERLEVTIGDRSGTFALLHAGTMTPGVDEPWATWPIVPGSGTGDLAGIAGRGTIDVAADGTHTFTLDYEL